MSADPLVISPVLRVTPEPISPTGSSGGKAPGKLSDPLKAATRKILITYNGQNYEIELFSNKSSLNEQILEHPDHLKSLTPLIEKICDYLQTNGAFKSSSTATIDIPKSEKHSPTIEVRGKTIPSLADSRAMTKAYAESQWLISFFQSATSSQPVSGNELPIKGDGNCGPRAVCAQLVAKTESGTYAELNKDFKAYLTKKGLNIDHITGKEEDQCQMLLRIIASQALRDQIDTLKTGKNPISWRIIIGLKAELNRRGCLPKLPGGSDEAQIVEILKRIKKQKDLKKAKGEDLEQVLKYAALFWEQKGNYVQNEFFYFCSIGLGGKTLRNIALAERSGSKAKITTIYPHEEYDNLPESEKEKVSQLDKNNTIFVYSAAQAGSGVANHFDTFKPEQTEFTQALIDVYVDRIVYELISSLRENNMQAVVNRLEQLNRIAPHVIKNLNEILFMSEERRKLDFDESGNLTVLNGSPLKDPRLIWLKHTDFNSLVISQILKKPKNSSS